MPHPSQLLLCPRVWGWAPITCPSLFHLPPLRALRPHGAHGDDPGHAPMPRSSRQSHLQRPLLPAQSQAQVPGTTHLHVSGGLCSSHTLPSPTPGAVDAKGAGEQGGEASPRTARMEFQPQGQCGETPRVGNPGSCAGDELRGGGPRPGHPGSSLGKRLFGVIDAA